jgi:hypothetical protein
MKGGMESVESLGEPLGIHSSILQKKLHMK